MINKLVEVLHFNINGCQYCRPLASCQDPQILTKGHERIITIVTDSSQDLPTLQFSRSEMYLSRWLPAPPLPRISAAPPTRVPGPPSGPRRQRSACHRHGSRPITDTGAGLPANGLWWSSERNIALTNLTSAVQNSQRNAAWNQKHNQHRFHNMVLTALSSLNSREVERTSIYQLILITLILSWIYSKMLFHQYSRSLKTILQIF